MNIETANRLLNYRKQHGLSQEELAAKIGVSRQAVSKWERAEASPDTDNLIELAKIYGVTLDELISGSDNKQALGSQPQAENNADSAEEYDGVEEETADNPPKDKVSFKNGIHVHSRNGDKVDISFNKGIHVHDKNGDKVDIDWHGINVEENGKKHIITDEKGDIYISEEIKRAERTRKILHGIPVAPTAVALYLIFGFLNICGGWAAGWLILFIIPLYYTLVDAVCHKKPNEFAYPVLVAAVYLWLGLIYSMWHPWWLLFLTVPLYYWLAELFTQMYKNNKESKTE